MERSCAPASLRTHDGGGGGGGALRELHGAEAVHATERRARRRCYTMLCGGAVKEVAAGEGRATTTAAVCDDGRQRRWRQARGGVR